MQVEQVTNDAYGHMLNSGQVFSPDDQWIVYDTRNDQTHISRTCCIEKVNVNTGKVVKLYSAPHQTLYGPGVGAASWHPSEDKVIFIHGLLNCDESQPYGFTRRFGAVLRDDGSRIIRAADARSIANPFVPGALRGGTHAHSWSGDGQWISFTYNDFLMEQLERNAASGIRDLRTIGVMSPAKSVEVKEESGENFSGEYFSVVAATVTEDPVPGSDEIDKAFDECWIGINGYTKEDGTRQKRAIAFQGNVKTADGTTLTEIFVSDIPDDVTTPGNESPLEGSLRKRPAVPSNLVQRRLTFTADRKYPGLQGPRFWLRSSPDGSAVYCLMKDGNGVAQIFEVSVISGGIRQITTLPSSVQGQFNVSPDGTSLALIADNSIWTTDIRTGESTRLTPTTGDDDAPVLVVLWNKAGDRLVYNQYVSNADGRYLQIFKISLN